RTPRPPAPPRPARRGRGGRRTGSAPAPAPAGAGPSKARRYRPPPRPPPPRSPPGPSRTSGRPAARRRSARGDRTSGLGVGSLPPPLVGAVLPHARQPRGVLDVPRGRAGRVLDQEAEIREHLAEPHIGRQPPQVDERLDQFVMGGRNHSPSFYPRAPG